MVAASPAIATARMRHWVSRRSGAGSWGATGEDMGWVSPRSVVAPERQFANGPGRVTAPGHMERPGEAPLAFAPMSKTVRAYCITAESVARERERVSGDVD